MEPWFSVNYAWLPGTLFGVVGGCWGGLAGFLAPHGKARSLVTGMAWMLLIVSVGFLIGALLGLGLGQPYAVWFSLLLPGLIGTIQFPLFIPLINKRYQEAEARKLQSRMV